MVDQPGSEETITSRSDWAANRDLKNPREFVQWAYKTILRRDCSALDCERLTADLDSSASGRQSLLEDLLTSEEYERRFRFRARSAFPEGHFYSPVPSDKEVAAYRPTKAKIATAPGIDLNLAAQRRILNLLGQYYSSIPFREERAPDLRYSYDNETYAYGDAIFLHSMIRCLRPRRLIEIGSGNSSCVTLDTNQLFFDNRIHCTFIEPYPDLLKSLLRADDQVELLAARLQDVDLGIFEKLERRDILFVDSTHVSKLESDVNRLFFEILPSLKKGVFIHIHDVFPGFEYPLEWLEEGRAWNEQYVLRAFLQYNECFRIRLFPALLVELQRGWFEQHMPLVLTNPGGSLWLERCR